MIADRSLTLHVCGARVASAQRTRWSAYAEQAIWNVWHPSDATWGGRSFPWSGWSTSNPGNNYYYSFVEATMYWALASGNSTWMNLLRNDRSEESPSELQSLMRISYAVFCLHNNTSQSLQSHS